MRRLHFTFSAVFLTITLFLTYGFCENTENKHNFDAKITLLSSIPQNRDIVDNSIRFSADYRNIAYVTYTDETHKFVHLNDKISPVYYAIHPSTPIFAAHTNTMAFIGYKSKNGNATVTIDGISGPIFDTVDNLVFSPDGKRYAYRGVKNNQQCVVLDGKEGPFFKGIPIKNNFLFSPDSAHFAYVALKENGCLLVLDEKLIEPSYNFITDIIFSPDSLHIAYKTRVEKTRTKETWRVVADGVEGEIYDKIFDLIYSYDSKHLAYAAIKNSKRKMVLVVDGKEKEYRDIYGLPVFSYDSKKLAFSYKENNNAYVSINDKRGPKFDELYSFFFSPDSSRHAYFAEKDDNIYCVVDGNESEAFLEAAGFKFSPDSKRYAYSVKTKKGFKIIVDGKSSDNFFAVAEPYFSPDSQHVVFRAEDVEKGTKWRTFIDGRPVGSRYFSISPYIFSADSRHLSYRGLINVNKSVLIVDGKELPENEIFTLLGHQQFSPDSNHIVLHAQKKENDWKVIVDGHILDETFGGFIKGTPMIFDTDDHFHTIGLRNPEKPEFILIEVDIPDSIKLKTELVAP